MAKNAPNLIEPWRAVLDSEFQQPYMQSLREFLVQERTAGKAIYPPADLVFNAFNHCAPEDIKVVMLGQDPYHGPDQAHGLCFSVPEGVMTPPSLVNIYKELNADIGMPIPPHGNLESWGGARRVYVEQCFDGGGRAGRIPPKTRLGTIH